MAIISCLFMVFCAIMGHGVFPCQASIEKTGKFSFPVLFYLIVFAGIMLLGWVFDTTRKKNNKIIKTDENSGKNETSELEKI